MRWLQEANIIVQALKPYFVVSYLVGVDVERVASGLWAMSLLQLQSNGSKLVDAHV